MCCKDLQEQYPDEKECFANKTSAEEKGKSFRIQTPKDSNQTFCRIHVDGCFVKNDKIRCDYVFIRCSNRETYYVEFKDTDVTEAYDQIVETIKTHFLSPKERNYGFIIATRITTSANRIIAKKKEEFKKTYGKDLIVKSKAYTHFVK
ncbi:MAG: hypothetical protein SFU99_06260 [Saprospiraceae bacterium]|nr:hypothetical protein [Saprospiraceae bacterium]